MLRYALAICCAVFVAGTSATALADPLSLGRQDFRSVAGARSIVAADFDRNGWVDLAHANIGRNSVTVLLNQGRSAPAFAQAYEIAVGLAPFALVAADLNHDGLTDLAVTNSDGHGVSLLMGRAAGGFARTDMSGPRRPRGITSADINKDGKTDLIVTGWDSNSVQVLFGDGSGGFVSGPAVIGHATHPQGVAAADFNRDGHIDLVVGYDSSGGLAVLTGDGGRNFAVRSISGQPNLNVVATGDFNRDGRVDVAAASTSWSRVAVYLNGAAGLRFSAWYAVGASPRGLIVADVNHDGILDLATANRGSSTVSVLLGEAAAPGRFAPAHDFAAGVGSRALAAADFDRDGRLDLASGNEYASAVTVLSNETAFSRAGYAFERLSIGESSGSFGGANQAWPADFNEDGQLDVLTLASWRIVPRSLSVLLTGGPTLLLGVGHFIDSFAVGDYNNDGHADVLVWQGYETAIMSVFLGKGDGTFTRAPATTSALRFWRGGDSAGDLNGDGNLDLVFVGYDPATRTGVLQTMNGVGDGTFRQGARVAIADSVTLPRIADVNRDGKPDVAAVLQRTLTVWFGDGAGGLRAASSTPWPFWSADSFELADINHDGFLDVCMSSGLSMVVGLGSDNGFAPGGLVALDTGPTSSWVHLGLADVNLDGRLDVVTDTGVILRGRGDGTFHEPELFEVDGIRIKTADFNRDGLPDLFVATGQGAVDVILNERNDVNQAPAVNAGRDTTIDYALQFTDFEPTIVAVGTDPDVHALTYEWRDQHGNRVPGRWLPIYGKLPGTYTFTVTAHDGRGASASDSVVVTILPTKEIVVWAADGFSTGNWTRVPDSTAAGGQRAYDRNAGAPKVTTPAAAPAHSFKLEFVADPTQTYKLWVRLKADANHWSNDSVWVQFSGAADASGTPVYRIGTVSALSVNLEECSGCGFSGWGWEDDAWGAEDRNGVTLRFPEGGLQRIQIQTREDGVSIDQVVLSAEKYLTARPGSAKNDTTILKATYRDGPS